MTKPKWESQIHSSSSRERLAGVRWVGENGDQANVATLRLMRLNEPDTWVQRAIDRVIQSSNGEGYGVLKETWDAPSVGSQRSARAIEIQRISRVFVHEVAHLTGAATSAALRELGAHYSDSDTAQALDRLSEFLGVLEQLHDAASSPIISEFDLSDCVRRSAAQVEHEAYS